MTDFPYVPEFITVHLGPPNSPARNVTVPFLEYIQNVASSELYPTWPENALRANIYAQVSFALNRIYTEWYRSRGYDFDITNSTAYDQAFVEGRDIFDNVADIVNELFDQYLARPSFIQPLFASYCDGRRVQCTGLSQWGTVDLAQQGLTPYEILTHYYGNDLDIRTAPIRPLIQSYPGTPLRIGTVSRSVEVMQERLNRISNNYPAIPKIYPVNGVFDLDTYNAVVAFQRIFNLTPDGVVGPSTWSQITSVYTAVRNLAELTAEGITLQDVSRELPTALREGMQGTNIRLLQFYLSTVGTFNDAVPVIEIDGFFGPLTRDAVIAFQRDAGLTPDGIVGPNTWNALIAAYEQIAATLQDTGNVSLPPTSTLVLGSQSNDVSRLQQNLNRLSAFYPEINRIPQTGYFGEQTRNAVLAFQQIFGEPVTGNVSPYTFYLIEVAANQAEMNGS
ncbi:MAG: peptidoglycan-binding protein [Eubacteriales bacterium]|nr:peptidoglycan-binding protein [Eubacteriales bacterium]